MVSEPALLEAVSDFVCKDGSDGFAAMRLPSSAAEVSDLRTRYLRLTDDKQPVGLDFLLAFALWCDVGIVLNFLEPRRKRPSTISLNFNARERAAVNIALIPAQQPPNVRFALAVPQTDDDSDDGSMAADDEAEGKVLAAAAPSRDQGSRKRAAPDDNPSKHMRM